MSPRTEVFAMIAKDAQEAATGFPAAVRLLMDTRRGLPGAQSFDGPRVSGGTSSSPTERHALNPDPASALIEQVDDHIAQAYKSINWLLNFVRSNNPHPPSARDRAEVERNNDPTPECAITRDLLGVHDPAHVTSDCGGVLPDPQPVSRWVYDFVRSQGRTPTTRELERHHKGMIVRVGA